MFRNLVLYPSIFSSVLLIGCGKDSNKDQAGDRSGLNLVNPTKIEGAAFVMGHWFLRTPVVDDGSTIYSWNDDDLSPKTLESGNQQFEAIKDVSGTKAVFFINAIKDSCEAYRTIEEAGEMSGFSINGVRWFAKKNAGNKFSYFYANTRKFDNCFTVKIASKNQDVELHSESDDLIEHFKRIVDGIEYHRLNSIGSHVQGMNPFLIPAFGKPKEIVAIDGDTVHETKGAIQTLDGGTNFVVSKARVGDCSKSTFVSAFADSNKSTFATTFNDMSAKASSTVVVETGGFNRIIEGIFKDESTNQCLLLNFSLEKLVAHAGIVELDTELEERLIFEMSTVSLIKTASEQAKK